jgi:uncharacterized protein
MERDRAIEILERLHSAQNEFYAGGSGAMLKQLLTADISWTVPGNNRIAGTYRGLEEVFGYFRRRRDLADHTFQLVRRDVIGGTEHRWSTVGLYEIRQKRIAACWLLPLDQDAFDLIWSHTTTPRRPTN